MSRLLEQKKRRKLERKDKLADREARIKAGCRVVRLKRENFPWVCVGCSRVFKFESQANKHAPIRMERMSEQLAAAAHEMDTHFRSL